MLSTTGYGVGVKVSVGRGVKVNVNVGLGSKVAVGGGIVHVEVERMLVSVLTTDVRPGTGNSPPEILHDRITKISKLRTNNCLFFTA